MKAFRFIRTPRVLPILAVAGCVLAGTVGAHTAAHAGPALNTPTFICLKHHDKTGATATYSVLRVNGSCFPLPGSAHIAIRNLSTGVVLRSWITVPVLTTLPALQWTGQFHYVTQGAARPGDTIRVWIVDGAWHRTFTITDHS